MSNTSYVTPVATSSDVPTGTESICTAAIAAVAGAAAWLTEEAEWERQAVAGGRDQRRRETMRLGNPDPHLAARTLATAELHLREPEPLIATAERLGYRREPLLSHAAGAPILLRSARGERLAIGRSEDGRLVIGTSGSQQRIRNLVRQHTTDRLLQYLKAKGMAVQTSSLETGEVQVLAREAAAGQRGGAAEVRAQVLEDGTTWIDIEKVKGTRCEEIVSGIAEAVGGRVSKQSRKAAWFQLPGEPARTKVKV